MCIAGQLNLADHVTSCNRKHLPMHFRAHACRTSSDHEHMASDKQASPTFRHVASSCSAVGLASYPGPNIFLWVRPTKKKLGLGTRLQLAAPIYFAAGTFGKWRACSAMERTEIELRKSSCKSENNCPSQSSSDFETY